MTETIERRERIYDGRLIDLDLYDVRLPDGEAARREIIQHPGAVGIIALDDSGRVVLVRQYRAAARQFLLEIPAGTLEPDEPPLTCAARELQEEAGYKPGKLEPIGGLYVAPGYTTEYIHLFLATALQPSTLPGDADEFIEVVHLPLADALSQIEDGSIQDGKTISGLLRVARQRGV
jgi:ADP-ribose pyrophosphatase